MQGHGFVPGLRVEVRDGVGQSVQGATLADTSPTAFKVTLPYATPGPYTLLAINPDGRTSTASITTPGTSASNQALRADS